MKKFFEFFRPRILPYMTLIAGAVAFALRLGLQNTGIDEKGLLIPFHAAGILLYILTVLFVAALVLCVRPLNGVSRYNKLFRESRLSAVGCVLAAAGILYTALEQAFGQPDVLTILSALVAVGAAVCLVRIGMFRQKGTHPSYLLHTVVTVYLMLLLVCQYRHWSPEPQFLLYFFPLLCSIFLTLTAYQATCLDARKGSRRWYTFCNQAALYFCFVGLVSEYWVFYLAMGLWTGTNLCSMRVSRHRSESSKEA